MHGGDTSSTTTAAACSRMCNCHALHATIAKRPEQLPIQAVPAMDASQKCITCKMWVGKRPEKLGQAMLTATSRRHDDGVQLWACQRCWQLFPELGRPTSLEGGQLDYQQVWHPEISSALSSGLSVQKVPPEPGYRGEHAVGEGCSTLTVQSAAARLSCHASSRTWRTGRQPPLRPYHGVSTRWYVTDGRRRIEGQRGEGA